MTGVSMCDNEYLVFSFKLMSRKPLYFILQTAGVE